MMSPEEYVKFHESFCEKMKKITKEKNHDYTGKSIDAFENYSTAAKISSIPIEKVVLCRIVDKLSRLKSFYETGVTKVSDEKIEDTLLDIANLSIITAAILSGPRGPVLSSLNV